MLLPVPNFATYFIPCQCPLGDIHELSMICRCCSFTSSLFVFRFFCLVLFCFPSSSFSPSRSSFADRLLVSIQHVAASAIAALMSFLRCRHSWCVGSLAAPSRFVCALFCWSAFSAGCGITRVSLDSLLWCRWSIPRDIVHPRFDGGAQLTYKSMREFHTRYTDKCTMRMCVFSHHLQVAQTALPVFH